jgi:hypothetical protein
VRKAQHDNGAKMNSEQKPDQNRPVTAGATLKTAIKKFNSGDYFSCHEYLEALWLNEHDPQRNLYKGILQISIGLLHLQRCNIKGAEQLLLQGCELLKPFIPTCFGIDLSSLQFDARTVLKRLKDPNGDQHFLPEDAIQIQASYIFNRQHPVQ